jgi:hypothetical protein
MEGKMTKRQKAIQRAENWKKALREHRVVRMPDGLTLTAYSSAEEAARRARTIEGATLVTDYAG